MKTVADVVVPARSGKAFMVKKGQFIRVIEVDGGQIGDFVVFDANNLQERFNQARTKANQGKIFLTTGDKLYSKSNKVLLTIVDDTYGIHDLQYGMCSKWVFESADYHGFSDTMTVGGPLGRPAWGCWENLIEALKDWKIPPEDIPDPLNIFQTVEIDSRTGKMGILPGRSKPGDYIEFRAEMDCLAALSACPSTGRPLRAQIFER
jgi:uncharacterized protein YcgI (DUF1989 family)